MNFWWESDPPVWSAPLQALSPLYAAGAAVHRAISRPVQAGVPVISIGNLTVGGAGKTPVTLCLAQRLAARGRRPAVLSRGYGRRSREALEVTADAAV
ncbi:MAG TPA: tetraacyldisaccharide 4'-kinase, partial [Myxococcales bacterium]|nr:tetraacyldisaccharide 4'-kinase [Myxococcales bacterium]